MGRLWNNMTTLVKTAIKDCYLKAKILKFLATVFKHGKIITPLEKC